MTNTTPENVPKALDTIAGIVLAYKQKPKTNGAKKRKKRAAKIAKKASLPPPPPGSEGTRRPQLEGRPQINP
jgi:hypothetical protein